MGQIKGSCNLPMEKIEIIRKMRRNDASLDEISEATGMSRSRIAHFLGRHGSTYGIAVRRRAKKSERTDFEKAWYGRVPRGHWMITKPWTQSGSEG